MKAIFVDDGVERESVQELRSIPPPETLRVPVIDHYVEEQYLSGGQWLYGGTRPMFGQKVYRLREIRGGKAVYE
jgi:hypothetical protein